MKKKYIIGSIIVMILFISFYNLYTLNNHNKKLTNCILSNIEDDLYEIRKSLNQNSDLITQIIETRKITYNNTIYLYNEHKNMNYFFNKIVKEITAIKPQNYIEKHLVTDDRMTALIKIPSLYNRYRGECHNVAEISLDYTDIKVFELILKSYELYKKSLLKIDGHIDIKEDYWIDEFNVIYNKNLEQIE